MEEMETKRPVAENEGVGAIVERLKRHPILAARVRGLLDLVENVNEVKRADDAERQAVDALRSLGQELLTEWARNRSRQAEEEAGAPERVKHSKKKFTGTARLGESASRNKLTGTSK